MIISQGFNYNADEKFPISMPKLVACRYLKNSHTAVKSSKYRRYLFNRHPKARLFSNQSYKYNRDM